MYLKINIKDKKRLFLLVIFICLAYVMLFSSQANAAQYEFPNRGGNPPGLRGVVSTGTIGRKGNNINDFYGPVTWAKAYSYNNNRANRVLNIDFEGGAQRGCGQDDEDNGVCTEEEEGKCKGLSSQHSGTSFRRIEIWSVSNDGGSGIPLWSHDIMGEGCPRYQFTIRSNYWNTEAESGKLAVLIKIHQFNFRGDDLPGSDISHGGQHNHPSSGYRLYSPQDNVILGQWGQFTGSRGETDSAPYRTDRNTNHALSTYILASTNGIPPGQRLREFVFATSCNLSSNREDIWLKWFDDDVDPGKDNSLMRMEVWRAKVGRNFDYGDNNNRIKVITGMTDTYAEAKNEPMNWNWRQRNKNNITPYDDSRGGEGFGGKGGSGKAKITVEKGYKYSWRFVADGPNPQYNNHRYGNRMTIWMPFDTAFPDEKDCPPDDGGGNLPTDEITCDLIRIPPARFDSNASAQRYQIWVKNSAFGPPYPTNASDNFQFNRVHNKGDGPAVEYLSLPTNPNAANYNRSGNIYAFIRIYRDTNENNGTYTTYQLNQNDCYRASCEVDIFGTLGTNPTENGNVERSSSFWSRIRIHNIGSNTLPANFNGRPLKATQLGAWPSKQYPEVPPYSAVLPISSGSYRDVWATDIQAPNDLKSTPIPYLIQYPDAFPSKTPDDFNLTFCSTNVVTFAPFTIDPTAPLNMDDEDPTAANYSNGGTINDPSVPPVRTRIYGDLRKNNLILETNINEDRTFGSVNESSSYPLTQADYVLGDRFCSTTVITAGSGWVTAGGVTTNTTPSIAQNCTTIANKPYLRVYGNDVSAGGHFSGPNASGSGIIDTYFSTNPLKNGSGVQFAAFATQAISGFSSASLIDTANLPSGADTFANSPSRGNFGDEQIATDYYEQTRYDASDTTNVNTRPGGNISAADLTKLQTHVNGNVTFNGGNINGRRALYVDGDVYISNNVTYGGFNNSYFALIVKGNIYIAPGVHQLDGLYVAQPDGGSGGQIVTCANSGGDALLNYTSCRNQLTINGAFVAQSVRFLRSIYSLRDSSRSNDGTTRQNAAEIFNFSPEMYTVAPPFKKANATAGSGSVGKYDSMVSLPPIF